MGVKYAGWGGQHASRSMGHGEIINSAVKPGSTFLTIRSGSAGRSVGLAAGALSCAVLAPATQPLTLGDDHDGLSHLRLRCPEMPARRDTQIEAARVRRFSLLQAVENQSRAWGIGCHSCTERGGRVEIRRAQRE